MNIIRNRIINFRVSEDEFRRLKAASTLQNARCLSDFARAATLRVATNPEVEPEYARNEGELLALDRRLATLELNVARLVEVLMDGKSSAVNVPHSRMIASSMGVTTCE